MSILETIPMPPAGRSSRSHPPTDSPQLSTWRPPVFLPTSLLIQLPSKHFNPAKSLKFESHFLEFALLQNSWPWGGTSGWGYSGVARLIPSLSFSILLDSPYFSYQYLTATVEDFSKLLDVIHQVYLDQISRLPVGRFNNSFLLRRALQLWGWNSKRYRITSVFFSKVLIIFIVHQHLFVKWRY